MPVRLAIRVRHASALLLLIPSLLLNPETSRGQGRDSSLEGGDAMTRQASPPPLDAALAAQNPSKRCNPRKANCPDTRAPEVAITSPVAGSTVEGVNTIAGTASDNVSVAVVEIQVDGGPFSPAQGTTSWTFSLDTTQYPDGPHTISARATDAAGNPSALSSIQLRFANTPAADPNILLVGDVRVDPPTLHAVGVQVLIGGDVNRNARVAIRHRPAGTLDWTQGMPLLRVHPETITVAVPQQFAGSIFDLVPGTTYDIEIHATDVDGAVDITRSLTATTRAVPRTDPAAPRFIPVQTAAAFRTAVADARPGDVITLAAGTYAGPFVVSASGTADQPIVLRGGSTAGVVLDGNNCTDCNVLEVSGSYVHVERLTLANAVRGLRFTGPNATGNVARRLRIANVIHGTGSAAGQSNFYICDNVIDGRLRWPWVFGSRPEQHWDDRGVDVTGDGHVVCHNWIRGFGDPVINGKRQARSWDVYGNDISEAWDGVEMDEGEGNVRVFHNRFTNVMAPISIQPIFGGPAYALRNVAFNVPDEQIKLKSLGGVEEPSGALVYHNTFVSPERALNLLSTITQHNFTFANNLFVGPDALWGARVVDWRAGIDNGTFDFNGYFPDGEFMFGTAAGVDRLYANFAQAQASGQVEQSGVLLTRSVFQSGFVGPADETVTYQPPDFTLSSTSNAVDRGALLAGINTRYSGRAPDLGALEAGCAAPIYGPRPEGLEAFASAIDCNGAGTLTTSSREMTAMTLLLALR